MGNKTQDHAQTHIRPVDEPAGAGVPPGPGSSPSAAAAPKEDKPSRISTDYLILFCDG